MTAFPDNIALDAAILEHLANFDIHPTNSDRLTEFVGGKWRRIDARMQALRKAGKIKLHRGAKANFPSHVKAHRWEVLA